MNCFLLSVAALALCQTDAQPGAVKELEAAQTRQQTPERQFDFWLGDWEVKNAKGEPVGRNTITRVEQGAGLLEHWSSSTGGTGTSISYHDPIQKIWVQVWMTGFKGALTARGLWSEGSMLLSSRDGDGRLISRTRWTPQTDGRVRQHWQKSNDDGASWSTAFDGYYSRVPKEAQATQSESSKDQAHAFDFLVGEWEMALTRYDQEGAELETRTTRSLVRRSAGGSALLD